MIIYIEKSGKYKNMAKNNKINRITKCVNRFRQLKTSKLSQEG